MRVLLIVEDPAQEKLIGALVHRIARESHLSLSLDVRISPRGYGGVLEELRQLAKDYTNERIFLPDVIIVGVDANCKGLSERREDVHNAAGSVLLPFLALAIADPHIERWYLLDGEAFKNILGRGCQAPDQKCEKDRYKQLLVQAILDCGVDPLLGGVEYAEDLVAKMDFQRVCNLDRPFENFIQDARHRLAKDKEKEDAAHQSRGRRKIR